VTVEYRKRFLRELAKLPSGQRKEIEHFAFDVLPALRSLEDNGKIERMKGYPGVYKIRFGDYRLGLRLEGNVVVMERPLHRKDIYRYFP